MPCVPTLIESCQGVIREHPRLLCVFDVSHIPVELLLPSLEKYNAATLARVESRNPTLVCNETDILWKRHCVDAFWEVSQGSVSVGTDGWRGLYNSQKQKASQRQTRLVARLRAIADQERTRKQQSRIRIISSPCRHAHGQEKTHTNHGSMQWEHGIYGQMQRGYTAPVKRSKAFERMLRDMKRDSRG